MFRTILERGALMWAVLLGRVVIAPASTPVPVPAASPPTFEEIAMLLKDSIAALGALYAATDAAQAEALTTATADLATAKANLASTQDALATAQTDLAASATDLAAAKAELADAQAEVDRQAALLQPAPPAAPTAVDPALAPSV